jgi:hypothetical protein
MMFNRHGLHPQNEFDRSRHVQDAPLMPNRGGKASSIDLLRKQVNCPVRCSDVEVGKIPFRFSEPACFAAV